MSAQELCRHCGRVAERECLVYPCLCEQGLHAECLAGWYQQQGQTRICPECSSTYRIHVAKTVRWRLLLHTCLCMICAILLWVVPFGVQPPPACPLCGPLYVTGVLLYVASSLIVMLLLYAMTEIVSMEEPSADASFENVPCSTIPLLRAEKLSDVTRALCKMALLQVIVQSGGALALLSPPNFFTYSVGASLLIGALVMFCLILLLVYCCRACGRVFCDRHVTVLE